MGPYYYWLSDAVHRDHLRRANEARLVAWAEAWNRIAADLRAAAAAVSALAARLRRMRQEAATVRELKALDDRILRDIGLSRAEIRDAVRNPWRRVPPRLTVVANDSRAPVAVPARCAGRDAA